MSASDVAAGEGTLAAVPLLRFASTEARALIEACFVAEACPFGATIVREGEDADAFFVLTSGRARVLKRGDHGEEVPLGTLAAGDSFGELALVEQTSRTATVRASSAVELLKLDRAVFEALLQTNDAVREAAELATRHHRLLYFLRINSAFAELPDDGTARLLEGLRPVAVAAGRVVLRQDDPAGSMYLVVNGRLIARRDGEPVDYFRRGDFFGERSLLLGAPRHTTIEAVTAAELLELPPELFAELYSDYEAFRTRVDERVAGYEYRQTARVPLDFADEILPAAAGADAELVEALEEGVASAEEAADAAPLADAVFTRPERPPRTFPHVYQVDIADCGAAALTIVCRSFGRNVSLARVRREVHTSTDGTSLAGIAGGAERLGLAVRTLKASKAALDELPLPAIAHWEGNHWLVVYDTNERGVRVSDPASGLRTIPRDEFESGWSGFVALVAPTPALAEVEEGDSGLGWVVEFFRPYVRALVKTLLLGLVAAGLEMTIPLFSGVIVNRVVGHRDYRLLDLIVLAMLGTLVLTAGVGLLQRYLLSRVTVRIDRDGLSFLAGKLLALPAHYFATRRVGDIDQRLVSLNEARQFFVQTGGQVITAATQLVVAVIVMLVVSPLLTLVFLATVPVYVVLVRLSSRRLKPLYDSLQEGASRYRSRQLDSIRGIETVKSMSAEESLHRSLVKQFSEFTDRLFRADLTAMLLEGGVQLVTFVSLALFLWVGALLVLDHRLSVGGLVAFNSLVVLANGPILLILGAWDQAHYNRIVLARLEDIVAEEPEQGRDRSHLKPVPTLEGRVALRNVRFAYPGAVPTPVLEDITLDAEPGMTVAIVGRSGSGKTTLAKLLAGLYEPTEGRILYDGVDLASLDHRDLRRHLGFVLQETHLFDDSIGRNIALGDETPDVERLRWAARIAGAQQFVERLPLAYDTRVGESGLSLSGGQKQRVAIARAVYTRPVVLILDEATSALDAESERAVQDGLDEIRRDRTCFVIAHRLSTVRDADLIVVLDRGRLVERGTHAELVERRGLYYYLVSQQLDLD
jgi:HlyB family type I secretion system ABC transporter